MAEFDRVVTMTRPGWPGTYQVEGEEAVPYDFSNTWWHVLSTNAGRNAVAGDLGDPPFMIPNAWFLAPLETTGTSNTPRILPGAVNFVPTVPSPRSVIADGFQLQMRYESVFQGAYTERGTFLLDRFPWSSFQSDSALTGATSFYEKQFLRPFLLDDDSAFVGGYFARIENMYMPLSIATFASTVRYRVTMQGYFGKFWAKRVSLSFGTRYRSERYRPGDTAIYQLRHGVGGFTGDLRDINGAILEDRTLGGNPRYTIEGVNVIGRRRIVEVLCHRVE